MSAITTIPAAEDNAAFPVPHHQALRLLSGLSPEAQRAVNSDPAEIVSRWIAGSDPDLFRTRPRSVLQNAMSTAAGLSFPVLRSPLRTSQTVFVPLIQQ